MSFLLSFFILTTLNTREIQNNNATWLVPFFKSILKKLIQSGAGQILMQHTTTNCNMDTATTANPNPTNTNQTNPNQTYNAPLSRTFDEWDDDDFDLIEFGIASNGGRLSMKR